MARDVYRETQAETIREGEVIAAQLQSDRQRFVLVTEMEPFFGRYAGQLRFERNRNHWAGAQQSAGHLPADSGRQFAGASGGDAARGPGRRGWPGGDPGSGDRVTGAQPHPVRSDWPRGGASGSGPFPSDPDRTS